MELSTCRRCKSHCSRHSKAAFYNVINPKNKLHFWKHMDLTTSKDWSLEQNRK